MRITDKNTGLAIDVSTNTDSKIVSAIFFGTQEILQSIMRQLSCLEAITYDAGQPVHIDRVEAKNSITIKANVKEALLFIAQHKFMDLSPETRTALKQVCLEIPQKTASLFDTLGSLFHRKSNPNPEQTPLKQPSPQMPQTVI